MIRERANNGLPGLPMLLLFILVEAGLIWMLAMNIRSESVPEVVFAALMMAFVLFLTAGLFMVNPNEGKVLQLFGAYKGTAKLQGLRWANPFLMKKKVSLRGHTGAVADHLKREIGDRLVKAGVEVIEARISHLAYAPEIAAAMLQRQQAGAIIAARQRIVEGAVGMVEMALDMLSKKSIIQLDEDRKAAMVSNLLVVLCGDRNTQPVINTGTIYQ